MVCIPEFFHIDGSNPDNALNIDTVSDIRQECSGIFAGKKDVVAVYH